MWYQTHNNQVQTPKFISAATKLAVTSFTTTTCLEIGALQGEDAKLVRSKHPFNIPFEGSSKPSSKTCMHLLYHEQLAEIFSIFNTGNTSFLAGATALGSERQLHPGPSTWLTYPGNVGQWAGGCQVWAVKMGGPGREAVEDGHTGILSQSWYHKHFSGSLSGRGKPLWI